MLRPRPVLAVPGLLLALALGGCAGSPGAAPAAPTAPATPGSVPGGSTPAASTTAPASPASPASPTRVADPAAAFCSELKANGASGSDFGAIPTFYPRQQLLDDVRGKLKAMGDATPPAEIAGAWTLQRTTLRKVEAAARKLPSGGRLADPRIGTGDTLEKAEDTVTRYWFAHCR